MKRANGEGTIFKRKDGRWCGEYYDDAPTPKRHILYGKTQAEVRKKLKERQMHPGEELSKESSYTLEKWVLFYLENYKKNEVKETTFNSYMGIYRKHIWKSKIGSMTLKKITSNDFQKYYNDKISGKYSAKTIKHIYIIFNCALNKAVQLRYIHENVNSAVVLPKCQKYYAKVLCADEVAKIFHEAKEEPIYPIIALTMCTGLRKGEVMALKWENINFEDKELYVVGNLCRVTNDTSIESRHTYTSQILTPKTEESKRAVPLTDIAIEALKIQQRNQKRQQEEFEEIYVDKGFVFTENDGSTLKQRGFMDKYHEFLEKYGISNIRFHDLRHTFASLLLEAGESPKIIQELLGHTSITTTMDIYTHISKQSKIKTVKALDDLVKNV